MSAKTEVSVSINRPRDIVFATLTDVAHHTEWAKGPSEIRDVSENPAQPGTTWTQITRFLGRDIEGQVQVNEYEANHKFGFRGDKPFPVQLRFTLQPEGDGAHLTFSVEIYAGGFFSLAGPLVVKAMQKQMREDLNALKAKLETEAQT